MNKLFYHYWPFIIANTVILYVLIIVFLPFKPLWSTILLFTLISYWSRLPGCGIPTPFYALYLADVVDFFSVVIAIHVGGLCAGIFSVYCNLMSRIGGVTPAWDGVIKMTVIQFFVGLITPLLFKVTGNLFMTMMLYTLLMRIGFLLLWFIYPNMPFAQYLIFWSGISLSYFVINGTYTYFFGSFFDAMLREGIHFSWMLFFIASATIVIVWWYLSKYSGSEYLLENVATKKDVLNIELHIPDPYEIILLYFEHGNRGMMTSGSLSTFKRRAFSMIVLLLAVRFFQHPPSFFESVAGLVLLWIIIEGLVVMIGQVNNASSFSGSKVMGIIVSVMFFTLLLGTIL